MQTINANYTRWIQCDPLVTDVRTANAEYLKTHAFIHDQICPVLHLKLTTRIGSKSSYGEVFRYVPPNSSAVFALKIVPNFYYDPEEVRVTQILSDLNIPYIVKQYAHGECPTIQLNKDSYLLRDQPAETTTISGHYIFSEMLAMDFTSYLIKCIEDPGNWKEHTCNILKAIMTIVENVSDLEHMSIKKLYTKPGVFHNDLHIGNVMFRCNRNGEAEIVFIDFGKVANEQSTVMINHHGTVGFFIYSLLSVLDQGWGPTCQVHVHIDGKLTCMSREVTHAQGYDTLFSALDYLYTAFLPFYVDKETGEMSQSVANEIRWKIDEMIDQIQQI